MGNAEPFLLQKEWRPYNFLKNGSFEPMVFSWMHAIAIYFKDPDGHSLEFIAVPEGEPRPALGVVSYDQWLLLSTKIE